MFTHPTKAAAVAGVLLSLAAPAVVLRAAGPAPTTAPAPAAMVDNPQYAMWSTFKPGTSATLVGDMDAGAMGKIHLEDTQTLKSVAADAVVLSQVTHLTLNGKPQPGRPPATLTVPAKQAKAEMSQIGTADVQAMGRTFPCRVFAVASPAGGPPVKETAYFADGVPGGVVKLVLVDPIGRPITFLLSATDVK